MASLTKNGFYCSCDSFDGASDHLFAFYIVVFANMHAKIQNSRGLPASFT